MDVINLDQIEDLKDDIHHLDQKIDKFADSTDKRFEKVDENMTRSSEITANAISKMADAIIEIKVLLIKDYVEKSDLKEMEKNITDKMDINNTNRKSDVKQLELKIIENKKDIEMKVNKNKEDADVKFEIIKNKDSVSVSKIIKGILYTVLISIGTLGLTKVLGG